MNDTAIDHLRTICLVFPEAVEDPDGVGSPAFKVNAKIFAMQHPVNNRPSMWCKAPPGMQQVLVDSEPERFFVPPYVGHRGWVGAWLDVDMDWEHIRDLIDESYRMTAPKKLLKLL